MGRNQRTVITGANSGIGLALLEQSIENEHDIIAVDLNTDTIQSRFNQNEKLQFIDTDLSTQTGSDLLFTKIALRWDSCDLFFANAGFAYFENLSSRAEPDWLRNEKIFSLNTLSPIYSWQKLKQLNKHHPFRIVMTSSAMAYLGLPGYALYSATKAALHSFAETQKWESTSKQKIVLVYPIATRTEFFRSAGSKAPFPSQTAETVARSIFSGLEKNKTRIYPSFIFRIFWLTSQWLPFLQTIYLKIEARKVP
jgi:short-subunit dehydrogenase